MRIWVIVALLVVCGCGRSLLGGPSQPPDSGVADAGIADAGLSDAGLADAGLADAGLTDAGLTDAGLADAGLTDAGLVDAGLICPPSPFATAAELASTPRLNPAAELLVIETTGQFMADDALYARVAVDLQQLSTIDAGAFAPWFLPDVVPGFVVQLADAGAHYTAWDCLNQTYGGTVTHIYPDGLAFIDIAKMVDSQVLAAEYRALPHVTAVLLNSVGVLATCGYANDFCLEIDGGQLDYLGYVEASNCRRTWFRLTSHEDGGSTLRRRDAGSTADDWMDELPQCASRLWGHPHRFPDGGFK